MRSNVVVSLEAYRLEKEVRKEMETVEPRNDLGGVVNLPSLDDYDNETDAEMWRAETWLWDCWDDGLID